MSGPSSERPTVTITTDGAARGNPGPGGWAALLQFGERERLLSGEEPGNTTNNAMELQAVAGALEALKRPCRVILRSDSTYVLEGLQRLRAGGSLPAKNRSLWERLADLVRRHDVAFEWVKGHSGDPRNERVDAAANAAAARAYAASEAQRTVAPTANEWTLALCSPAGSRPVQWKLRASVGQPGGTVAVSGVTGPTAMYQALLQGLQVARQLAGGNSVRLVVVSNYELIIKQGRGEWGVKNHAQQQLAAQAAALQRELGEVRFEYAPTKAVIELIGP